MKKSAKKLRLISLLAILTTICFVQVCEAQTHTDLISGFVSPPDSAKPLTWWHWMNGNVTKEGITLDLEKMKEVGIAGFQIFDVGQGIPQGPVKYLSPEWLELMQWAAKEADRLGLEYDMHNCPGWSSTGGPWVTPEYAMQKLVWCETVVRGGRNVTISLVQPSTNLDYYRDAFVLAFPALGTDRPPLRASSNNGDVDLKLLAGGEASGGVEILPVDVNDPTKPGYLQLEYAEPVDVRMITIGSFPLAQPSNVSERNESDDGEIRLDVSDDGVTFHKVTPISVNNRWRLRRILDRRERGVSPPLVMSLPKTKAKFFRLVMPQATYITELRFSSGAVVSDWMSKSNAGLSLRVLRGGTEAPTSETVETDTLYIDPESVVEISKYMDKNGRLNWQAPAGNWTIIRFGYTPTGTRNRAGSSTGTGLEIDKYNREAVDFHWKINIEPVLSAMAPLAKKGLAGILIDSYEAGMQNWTVNFPEEFRKRCGYDLKKYMPAMTGKAVGNLDISDRFLWDMRRTMSDMMADNYYGYMAEMAHKNNLKFYVEPYRSLMFDETEVGYMADVVMGEFWQDRGLHSSIKLASSIGHVGGIKIIGAESFTSRSKWTEYPYSLKALGDWMYTLGLNRYIFHRHAMQPHPDAVPGMTMGPWGGHFDRTNTWWNQNAAAWLKYVARCQYVLQQGLFVSDLLYYTGEDAPLRVESNRDRLGVPNGYDYDIAGKKAIINRISVKDGRIILPDGMSYRLLVLPEKTTMTVEAAQKLRDLVMHGMWMVGPKPEKSPTLVNYPTSNTELQSIADELWGNLDGNTVTERAFGKGRVFWGQSVPTILNKLNLKPDFVFTSRSGNAQINYIHRRVEDTDVYFVANHRYESEDLVCTFRMNGKKPEFWKADTGEIISVSIYDTIDSRTRMPIQLDPAGSVFVVFRPEMPTEHIVAVSKNSDVLVGSDISTTREEPPLLDIATVSCANSDLLFWQNGNYSLQDGKGGVSSLQISGISQPIEIEGPWLLSFPPNLGAPSQVTLTELISWPEYPDNGVKYFSGTATYTKKIDIAADALANGKRLFLDLGRVMVLAEVFVNGKNIGVLWKAPYCVDITDAVHSGSNDLEIKITNLWPNRLIGDEQLSDEYQYGGSGDSGLGGINKTPQWYITNQPRPKSERITFTMYKYYDKNSPLLESGLIGPVKLMSAMQYTID